MLFLHGFPELWYSWRHQMLHLAAHGYRAIAPDLRGYDETNVPLSAEEYSAMHIVGDLVALLDWMGLEGVYLVGHNWGALIACWFCLFRPDWIRALVNMSVQFHPRDPQVKILQRYRDLFGDDFYMCKFQEPGKAEEAFATVDASTVMKSFFSFRGREPIILPEIGGLKALFMAPAETPPWLTEEDIGYYASKFEQTGFTGGLNYYRAFNRTWDLTAPWAGAKIRLPVKFIIGDQDFTYHVPGVREYLHKGGFKNDVPGLVEVVVLEGVAHFVNQEKPDEVSNYIYDFISKF